METAVRGIHAAQPLTWSPATTTMSICWLAPLLVQSRSPSEPNDECAAGRSRCRPRGVGLLIALDSLPAGIHGRERPPGGGWHGRAHAHPPRCRSRHPERGGRSHLRPKAPERRRRSSGRAITVRQAAVYGSAGAHMELAFRCTCTPLSDVHSPISTHPSRSAFMTSLRGAGSSAMSRTRGSPA